MVLKTPPHRVSVIIATHNRPEKLRGALASVRALEGPDLSFEILVGDNGATPETAAVVAEFGGLYAKTDVRGCPAARNLAMRRMTGASCIETSNKCMATSCGTSTNVS